MLKTIILNVLNKVLNGNIESVDFYFSGWQKAQLTTKSKIPQEYFIRKTKYIISENDIGVYDEDEEDLTISIDLTEEFINKIILYVKSDCMNEFEEMRKSR